MYATVAATLFALAAAAPLEKRAAAGPTDAQILNYALTLEHLENQFYNMGLKNFTSEDFTQAGADPSFYNNLKTISSDEQTHVDFLTSALQGAGAQATEACTYDFGVTDAESFLMVAALLEGVGVSAYLGAAQFISNKDYLTAAGAILTVEARHSAYLRFNQSPRQQPFPSPFDIPLGFDEVYSLAAQFITSCPKSNPALPVKAFPAIAVTCPAGAVEVGSELTLKVATDVPATSAFFITTLGPVSAPLKGSGSEYTVTVPAGVQKGQEYLVLTSSADKPTDDTIVAGPAVVMIKDDAIPFEFTGGKGGNWNHGGNNWDNGNNGHKNYHAKGLLSALLGW